jgi:hypothetical protein
MQNIKVKGRGITIHHIYEEATQGPLKFKNMTVESNKDLVNDPNSSPCLLCLNGKSGNYPMKKIMAAVSLERAYKKEVKPPKKSKNKSKAAPSLKIMTKKNTIVKSTEEQLTPCHSIICWGVCKREHSKEQDALTKAYYAAYNCFQQFKKKRWVRSEDITAVLKGTEVLMELGPVAKCIGVFRNQLTDLKNNGEKQKSVNEFLRIINVFIQGITKFVKSVRFHLDKAGERKLFSKHNNNVVFVFGKITIADFLPTFVPMKRGGIAVTGKGISRENVKAIIAKEGIVPVKENVKENVKGQLHKSPTSVWSAWNSTNPAVEFDSHSAKSSPKSAPPGFEKSSGAAVGAEQWGNKGNLGTFSYLPFQYYGPAVPSFGEIERLKKENASLREQVKKLTKEAKVFKTLFLENCKS